MFRKQPSNGIIAVRLNDFKVFQGAKEQNHFFPPVLYFLHSHCYLLRKFPELLNPVNQQFILIFFLSETFIVTTGNGFELNWSCRAQSTSIVTYLNMKHLKTSLSSHEHFLPLLFCCLQEGKGEL